MTTLLIDLYHYHTLPAGRPDLAKNLTRFNQKAEEELKRMEKDSAPHKPKNALEALHHFVNFNKAMPWKVRAGTLRQHYLQNRFKEWPAECLTLLALIFPPKIPKGELNGQHFHNDVPRQRLDGKQSYNLFKTLTAMLLHLEEGKQLATA